MLTKLFGEKAFSFKCSECSEVHSGSPSYSHRFPSHYFDVPENERGARAQVSDDLCRIKSADEDDEISYFIRVVLEIPIKGATEPFMWGVWVSQSKESFDRYVTNFDKDQSEEQSFGWLAVDLPFYNQSGEANYLESLECQVHWGKKGQRPRIYLWESEHPLAVDQHKGISWRKAKKIAKLIAHPTSE